MNKKNSEYIAKGFEKLGDNVQAIERKIDVVKYEMARNYVTNDTLNAHIGGRDLAPTLQQRDGRCVRPQGGS